MAYQGFQNTTPFAAEPLLLTDEEGAGVLTLVAKGTFDITRAGLAPAAEQAAIVKAAKYRGAPDASSLEAESEATFGKAATDVVILGHARPERGRVEELDVTIAIGRLEKQIRVFGDRVWRRTLGLYSISPPKPFDRMPLVWERAFGGWDRSSPDPAEHAAEPQNPVGTGFVRHAEGRDVEGMSLPNLEDPASLIERPTDRPAPAGTGFVAPHWAPRRRLAGTYDEAWRERRFPRLPADFDRRHNNVAPPDLQAAGFFRGGERVEIVNASERGALRFELPQTKLEAAWRLRGEPERVEPMVLDTVVIDTDAHRVSLVWRASARIHRRAHDLVWARVQGAGEDHGAS